LAQKTLEASADLHKDEILTLRTELRTAKVSLDQARIARASIDHAHDKADSMLANLLSQARRETEHIVAEVGQVSCYVASACRLSTLVFCSIPKHQQH
jgi:hypothetical protein